MIDLFDPPLPGTSAFSLRRLRRFVWLRYSNEYRFIPTIRLAVNNRIRVAFGDVRDSGDARALREAERLIAAMGVR